MEGLGLKMKTKIEEASKQWAETYYYDNQDVLDLEPFHREVFAIAHKAGAEFVLDELNPVIEKQREEIELLKAQLIQSRLNYESLLYVTNNEKSLVKSKERHFDFMKRYDKELEQALKDAMSDKDKQKHHCANCGGFFEFDVPYLLNGVKHMTTSHIDCGEKFRGFLITDQKTIERLIGETPHE